MFILMGRVVESVIVFDVFVIMCRLKFCVLIEGNWLIISLF